MSLHEQLRFDNTYASELEGLYAPWQGDEVPDPELVKLNSALAVDLGIEPEALETPDGAALLAGSRLPEHASPLAQAYAGHQFGGFSPQLGDGRALLIGELVDRNGVRRDLHLKGSGPTPFSRGGDGKAALGPVLREYLVSEFMHSAGVPTTRALAAVATGESVMREGPLPGAVLARVASSHLRVGTFQFFSARNDMEKLRRLADYTIRRHFPELEEVEEPYLGLLRAVTDRQAALIAKWMAVGFVHGVMNTDNTTISGETIDYGPCAFIDAYDPSAVFSSIDHSGRYAYQNQPSIAQWNLGRFAETLLPLVSPADPSTAIPQATEAIEAFPALYEAYWLNGMRAKLGLTTADPGDLELITQFLTALEQDRLDFTRAFRSLGAVVRGDDTPFETATAARPPLLEWKRRWLERLEGDGGVEHTRAATMDLTNPVYVPRNHKVEEALQASVAGDFAPFELLLEHLTKPYARIEGSESLEEPAPEGFGPYRTFCGT